VHEEKLNLAQIKKHWTDWAKTYGTDLRATTKTSTAKKMEVMTLVHTISSLAESLPEQAKILEVGCGNGHNILSLASHFDNFSLKGVDYVEEMIRAALDECDRLALDGDRVQFGVGDALNLNSLDKDYDLVFTVRCLINLNTDGLQLKAVEQIQNRLKSGGYLLLLENSQSSYADQNSLRKIAGLEPRTPAEFNHFLSDSLLQQVDGLGLERIRSLNFSSLHDLVLYVLVPMINNGKVEYDHPLVEAATNLTVAMISSDFEIPGEYGQNQLHVFRKNHD